MLEEIIKQNLGEYFYIFYLLMSKIGFMSSDASRSIELIYYFFFTFIQ